VNEPLDIERALRASLERHAHQAPPADLLAERVIARAGSAPVASRPRGAAWRAWLLPALASAAVVAVVLGVAVAGLQHHGGPAAPPPGASRSVSVTPPPSPTPTPVHSRPPANAVGLHNFRAIDLTFYGPDQGWALGTSDCLSGPGRCSAMVHTTDGVHWRSMRNPPGNVGPLGCTAPCVSHVRFATPQIGYAYGPQVFEMTVDGGKHWAPQEGGAVALETLSGNVIRVIAQPGCPPGCTYQVDIAPIGSRHWTPVPLPGAAGPGAGVILARSGHDAYLADLGNPAGGASARAVFWTSSDDGQHWTRHDDPCPTARGADQVVTTSLTTAADGAVVVSCVDRATQAGAVAVSTNGGRSFTVRSTFTSAGASLVGAASARTIFVMSDVLYRSTDGGMSFRRVQQNSQGPLGASWIGFEDAAVGRILEPDANVSDAGARTIWTTYDAGQHWESFTFPS
jgi:photosystem II stability/assembly factor-like uncharacterized protein